MSSCELVVKSLVNIDERKSKSHVGHRHEIGTTV
nr:MAG TPA: hypothetical protein [Caudoviricetes sp.]